MVTGIGWNAGLEARPLHPAMTGVTALVIHVLPLVALMVFLAPALAGSSRRRGVSVAAVLALAFGLFSAVFSITHPHAVGVHDLNDVVPIAILDAGALLWLVRGRRRSARKPAAEGRNGPARGCRLTGTMKVLLRTLAAVLAVTFTVTQRGSFFVHGTVPARRRSQRTVRTPGEIALSCRDLPSMTDYRVRHLVLVADY